MAPKPLAIDWELVFSVAEEVAHSEQRPSRAKVANRLGILESTLGKRARQGGYAADLDKILTQTPGPPKDAVEAEGVKHHEDGTSDLIGPPTDCPWTREGLMKHYGFDPSEWKVRDAKLNKWGSSEEPKWQLKLSVVPVGGVIQFPDPGDWTPPPKPRKRKAAKYLDVVVISDHHAPHHEPTFHRLFLEYLSDAQPGLIEVNGDLLDFSTISRHRDRDGYAQSVNECLAAGFNILYDYRHTCPDATIRFKRGNHSERIRHLMMDNAKELHNVTPAGEKTPALCLSRLLHLDDLHVEYIDVEWDQAKTQISRKLTARHGFSTSRNAGEAMLDKLAGSTVQGHDHRLGMTFRTEHQTDPDDDPLRVRMGVQGGCACIIPGGLGYINGGEPNWQNGCTAFRVWPDGDFHSSIGVYLQGRFLAPNGERYAA